MKFEIKSQRILDFDCECRPLSWISSDYVTSEITAIAASFGGPVRCWLLGEIETEDMLIEFRCLYDMADIVTGHFIRGFDLPTINGAMLDFGFPPLAPKLVSDTKIDLVKARGISKSQESLSAMLGLDEPKVHMNQQMWRQANRLQRIDLTRERVIADVRQHQVMRRELIRLNMLAPPHMWYPKPKDG
jgi:hypothetical protein